MRKYAALILLAACQTAAPLEEGDLDTRTLTYDLQGSGLRIDTPALGAFVTRTNGDNVRVAGTSRASHVSIEGRSVPVIDGRFETLVHAEPGINVVHGKAAGIAGERAFLYGDFTPPGVGNAAGVVTRVNRSAFADEDGELNDLTSVATYALSRIDLFQGLQQPFQFHYDFIVGSLDMQVEGVIYDGASSAIHVLPRAGGARTDGTFGEIALDLGLTLHLFGTHHGAAHVKVDRVDYFANVEARFGEGGVAARLSDLSMQFGAIDVTTDLPASQYVDKIVEWIGNQARTQVANVAAAQVEANAANAFALALNQLALPPTFDLSAYGIAATLATSYVLDGATFAADGAGVSAAPALTWPAGQDKHPGTPGSLRLDNGTPVELPRDPSVALALSFDLMNQALYAVWGQGGFARAVWGGGKKWGVTFAPLTVDTALPPVITPTDDGAIALTVGDASAHTRVSVLGFASDIDVNLSLRVAARLLLAPEGDRLVVQLRGEPALAVDINHLLGVVPDVVVTAMERLVETFTPQIAAALVGAVVIPLPSLPLDQIHGFEGHSFALAPPGELVVDAAASRVLVSASFLLKTQQAR